MKKILIGLLFLGTFSAFANCINAYELKAEKRMMSNHGLVTAATFLVFPFNVMMTDDGADGDGRIVRVAPFENNTYKQSLDMIKAAIKDELSQKFSNKLERKLALNAYNDTYIVETKRRAISNIKKLNEEGKICSVENGKVSVLSFRELSNLVIENIKD